MADRKAELAAKREKLRLIKEEKVRFKMEMDQKYFLTFSGKKTQRKGAPRCGKIGQIPFGSKRSFIQHLFGSPVRR